MREGARALRDALLLCQYREVSCKVTCTRCRLQSSVVDSSTNRREKKTALTASKTSSPTSSLFLFLFLFPLPTLPLRAADDAAEDPDAAFEARLASLKKAKGQMPYGESRKDNGGASSSSKPSTSASPASPSTPARKNLPIRTDADYKDETLFCETGPHPGDATVNVALGITLLWLPLTIAALGRAAFVRYRFTDRRLSVISSAPWKSEQLDADYRDVKQVLTVGRG